MRRKQETGSLAPENRRQGGRGRPFSKGNTAGRRFVPGQIPNPGGRPKDAPGFRARCREMAARLLEELAARIDAAELTTDEVLRSLEILADRGGYLGGDKLANAEGIRWRWGLAVLELENLTPDQRDRVWREMAKHEREVLGEPKPAAAAGTPPTDNDQAHGPSGQEQAKPATGEANNAEGKE